MNIIKSSIIATIMLVGAFGVGQSALAGPSAGSYDVNITCGSFNSDQAAAQAYFDANGQPANLDQNGDGNACADPNDGDFTSTGPSAGSYDVNTTCDSFNGDQAAAQMYFDEHDSPANLDQNGDGVACNDDVPVNAADVVEPSETQTTTAAIDSLPNTGTGVATPERNEAMVLMAAIALLAGVGAVTSLRSRRS